ncbi:MAG: hypothetical protein IH904_00755 [Proteobacteria bacterium]|nr:hypothetical protein [Pseudomonadota bacterium]
MELTNKLGKTLLGAGLAVALGFAIAAGNQALAQGGTWEIKAPLPPGGVSPSTAGVIGGKLYASGFKTVGGLAPVLVVYDPATDTWDTTKAPPPTLRGGKGGVIDGKLYVVGGCLGSDCRIGINNILEMYDPATDTWATLAPMPTARAKLATAVIDGKLFVVGGFPACPPCVPQFATLEVYDPATDTWDTTRAPMPTPREGMKAAAIDGKLHVVGGFLRPSDVSTGILEVYDPATDTWDTTKAPMPTDRDEHAVDVIAGQLYAVGGNSTSAGGIVATLEVYDPPTDSWTTRDPMPTARWQLAVGVINGKLYAVGGGGCCSLTPVLEVFTPGPDVEVAPTEFDFADVPTFTSEHTVVTIQNVGAVSHTVTGISIVGDPSFSESSTATPVVLTPGATEDVTVTYLPTSIGLKLATLTVTSDEGTVDVSFLGNGLEGLVEDQTTVLETNVNDAIIAFTLVGSGSGKSANGRLGAFANMIEAAGDLIETGFIEDACGQLKSALKRVDGEPRPPDFVAGTDAEFIEAEIIFLRDSLGCG